MADKEFNIDVGGQNIVIPAWAQEETMLGIATNVRRMANIDSKLVNVVSEFSDDLGKMLGGIADSTAKDTATTKAGTAQTKNITRKTEDFGRRVVDAASFMGNTEKPLTSMVGAMEKLGPAATAGIGKFFAGLGKNAGSLLSSFGKGLQDNKGVISDATFMWLGWSVGKLEAFSEVQQIMIDNGAIMFENTKSFEELRKSVNVSGVTYDAFAKTIGANNAAIAAFGGNVSIGTRRFQKFFSNLELSADAMGDFGLSNTELLQQTGEFLEYQRLTGGLVNDLAGLEENLTKDFTQLQVETAALASITGLTRSQALQNMITVENVDFAAGMKMLDGTQKDAVEQLKNFSQHITSVVGSGTPFDTMFAAFARDIMVSGGNLAGINPEAIAGTINQADVAALKKQYGNDIFDRITARLQAGDASGVRDIFLTSIQNPIERIGTSLGSINDPVAQASNALAQGHYQLGLVFGNATPEKFEGMLDQAAAGLAEAGTTTKLLNDATKAFMHLQEIITPGMEKLTLVFGNSAELINDVIQGITNPKEPGNFSERQETEIPTSSEDINNIDTTKPVMPRPTGSGILDGHAQAQWDSAYGETHNIDGTPKNMYFGGPVTAGNPYIVGDGVDMSQAELFVPSVDGKILSNRELRTELDPDLTNDENSSTMQDNLIKEYMEIIEAKKRTVATLENLKKFTKNKMMDDRLKNAIHASGS